MNFFDVLILAFLALFVINGFRKGFIIQTRVGFERGGGGYNLTDEGRKYVVENRLAG